MDLDKPNLEAITIRLPPGYVAQLNRLKRRRRIDRSRAIREFLRVNRFGAWLTRLENGTGS